MNEPMTPTLAVDVIIQVPGKGVLLIERQWEPKGWALPGGHVDIGESCPAAAVREVREETGLRVELECMFGVYSKPNRDPRRHVVSCVYVARIKGSINDLKAGDDAKNAQFFSMSHLPQLAFDHSSILDDYQMWRRGKAYPALER